MDNKTQGGLKVLVVLFLVGEIPPFVGPAFSQPRGDTTQQIIQLVRREDFQAARKIIEADSPRIWVNWRDTETIGCWAYVVYRTGDQGSSWKLLDEVFRRTRNFTYDYLDVPDAHTQLGYYHLTHHSYSKGKSIGPELASKCFEKALGSSRTAQVHHGLAMAYLQMSRGPDSSVLVQKAIENEEAAIALSDTNWPLFHGMGEIYAALGDVKNATKFYYRSIELNPQNFITYYEMATVYMNAGYLDSALTSYNTILSINPRPEDDTVYQGICDGACYQIASLYAAKREVEEAIDSLRLAKSRGFRYPLTRIRRDKDFSGIIADQKFNEFLNGEYIR